MATVNQSVFKPMAEVFHPFHFPFLFSSSISHKYCMVRCKAGINGRVCECVL